MGYSTFSRRTYEAFARNPRQSGMEAFEHTRRILGVDCPRCGSLPGHWCEYASDKVSAGRFQSLHNERHYRAAERLKMWVVAMEAIDIAKDEKMAEVAVMRAVVRVERAARENRLEELWRKWGGGGLG